MKKWNPQPNDNRDGRRVDAPGEAGQSLVQILISIAMMGLLFSVMASLTTFQSRETLAMQQKMAWLEFESGLLLSLLNSSVCDYVVNNPTSLTFNSNQLPARIVIPSSRSIPVSVDPGPPLRVGPTFIQEGEASPLAPSVRVKSIQLEVQSGSNGSYKGAWNVELDQSTLVRGLKPISVSTALLADDSNPGNARVVRCGAPGEWLKTVVVTSTQKSCGGPRPNCPANSAVVRADCPTGYTVSGCGYILDWNPYDNGDGGDFHSNSPDNNYAIGNGCTVESGGAPGCGVCFQATATCIRFY